MAGPNLPTNVDATYPDNGDPSAAAHQQAHDVVHRVVNRFDVDAAPADGQIYTYSASLGVFRPLAPAVTAAQFQALQDQVTALGAGGGTGTWV